MKGGELIKPQQSQCTAEQFALHGLCVALQQGSVHLSLRDVSLNMYICTLDLKTALSEVSSEV